MSLGTHLIREQAVSETALMDLLVQQANLALASDSGISASGFLSCHSAKDIIHLGWALEVPETGAIILGRLMALDLVEHMHGDYRKVLLCTPAPSSTPSKGSGQART